MAEVMNIEAVWQEGLRFEIQTGSGHQLTVDSVTRGDGVSAGPPPIELLLVANATCMGMDVISILQKMRQQITSYALRVTGERADDHPRVFTQILIEHVLEGEIDEAKLAHAIALSEEKYCSVSAMLNKVARIETKYRVQ